MTGHYVLNFAGDTFRVFTEDPRGLPEGEEPPAVESGVTEFDANSDTTVWVKGIAADGAMCMGRTVTLAYMPGERPVSTEEGNRTSDIIKINVSEVQIEINNTETEDDDIIMVGDRVPVRARIFPWWPTDRAIELSSEGAGRFEFSRTESGFADTLSLTLSRAGTWTRFYATGKEGTSSAPWQV
ncbi:MAG: hypothetical protein AB1696_19645 [Planctomycetota bacterium]